MSLQDIYTNFVKGKSSINTAGIGSNAGALKTQFERDPITKELENKLNQTVNKIFKPENTQQVKPNLQPEIEDDAQQNIIKALEELKKLNAL